MRTVRIALTVLALLLACKSPLSAFYTTDIPRAIACLSRQVKSVDIYMQEHARDVVHFFSEHVPSPREFAIELRDLFRALDGYFANSAVYDPCNILRDRTVRVEDQALLEAHKLHTLEDLLNQIQILHRLGMMIVERTSVKINKYPGICSCFEQARSVLDRIDKMNIPSS